MSVEHLNAQQYTEELDQTGMPKSDFFVFKRSYNMRNILQGR